MHTTTTAPAPSVHIETHDIPDVVAHLEGARRLAVTLRRTDNGERVDLEFTASSPHEPGRVRVTRTDKLRTTHVFNADATHIVDRPFGLQLAFTAGVFYEADRAVVEEAVLY